MFPKQIRMELTRRKIKKNIKNVHQDMDIVEIGNIPMVRKELTNGKIHFLIFFFCMISNIIFVFTEKVKQ